MNALEFRPIFQEAFAPALFEWRQVPGSDLEPCGQCNGTGQDTSDGHMGCSGCQGKGSKPKTPVRVCSRMTAGQATVQAWYCQELARVIIKARGPIALDEDHEDGDKLEERANRVAGVTAAGLVVRAASSEAQAIRKAVAYCDRYRDAWRAVSPAPADMEGKEQGAPQEPAAAQAPLHGMTYSQAKDSGLHVEQPHTHPFQNLADAISYCLGPDQAAPAGFINDHADLLAFGDAREDGDAEQADQHYTRLRESLMVTHADHDQARDMLTDARALLELIGEALGVDAEPHQNHQDRLLAAAKDMADAYWHLRKVRTAAAMPVERLIDKAHGARGAQEIPGWLLELVRSVFDAASAAVHANHQGLGLGPGKLVELPPGWSAETAQPVEGEEIHVNVAGADVYTLPLQPSGMERPRFVVHVPAEAQDVATVAYNLGPAAHEGAIRQRLEELGWMPPEQAVHAMIGAPAFCLGGFSECGPDGGEPVEGRLVHNPGDPSVGIPEAWELDGASPLAEYIRDLEVKAEAGAQAFLALIPAWHEPTAAPWPDFHGRPIYPGDTIRHPDGQEGRVVYRPERETDADRWLVDYGGPGESRLVLQVGDRGQAAVQR